MDTEIYDFIIIGCGAVGSAVARELTLLGQKCLILEKNQEVLGEASSGNTGHLVRKMSRAKRATDICRILGAKIQIISINQLIILKMNQTRFARSVFFRPETSIMSWLELH